MNKFSKNMMKKYISDPVIYEKIIKILLIGEQIRKTDDNDYFINSKTGRKISRKTDIIKKIWNEWFEKNKEELTNKIVSRRNIVKINSNNNIYTIDIIQQLKIDRNDNKEIVYIQEIMENVMIYLDICTRSKTRLICKKWNNYANILIKQGICDIKIYNEETLDRYIMKNISNIEKDLWKIIMERKNFDSWKYFNILLIYKKYDIVDLFYKPSEQSLMNHNYCTIGYADDLNTISYNVNIHIKYTRFPLILCIIYLISNTVFTNNNRSKYLDCLKLNKYFESIIPENCSCLSHKQLCDKIILYYPDPFCLIPGLTKINYSYEYRLCVEKLYHIF